MMIQMLFLHGALLLLLANQIHGAQWKREDINPDPGSIKVNGKTKSITPDCDGSPCGYKIHYFTAGSNTQGRTIIYVSGGPGQIVDRNKPNLDTVKDKFKIVYFDIRGAGLSAPQKAVDNSTDRFLRAKYVVKDIEEIRKRELGDKPWDAIYGHSAGSVVAQVYAAQFGEARVKTLILSAPISRHVDNEPFRAAMIEKNLENILKNNSDAECVFASTAVQKIRDKVAAILSAAFREVFGAAEVDSAPVRSPTFLKESNNFCFLNPTRIENIKAALTQKLDYVIRDFGSISFVLENHEDLKKQSKEFRKEFPYPDIFFSAIRTLDRLGSPKARNSDLLLDTKSFAVDAALVIGYYLENARTEDVGITTCNSKAAFFLGLNEDSSADIARTIYCDRFDTAAKILESLKNGSAMRRSKRAANVLGINDGIHRWPVRVMSGSARGCNSGSEFVVFAKGSGADNKRTARNLVKRVGFEKNEIICEWDPARYKHNVPALFLKGSQDAAIHGCQAEYFFKEGVLTSDKHFVEFPELGHDWISEVKPERKGDLATLLAEFVDDPAHFKDSNNAQEAIARLGANFVTVASFAASGC